MINGFSIFRARVKPAQEDFYSAKKDKNTVQGANAGSAENISPAFDNQKVLDQKSKSRSHQLFRTWNQANEAKGGTGTKTQDIGKHLHIAVKENNAAGIHDFAMNQLKKIPENERLAWLRNVGADKAMSEAMRSGSPEVIDTWGEVVQLLPGNAKFAFLDKRDNDGNSIACSIFSNKQPGAMKAWGDLLEVVPDHHQERSKLLLTRRENEAGTPALAELFERGDIETLNQFGELAKKHVWSGNKDIGQVLLDCERPLKLLTSQRGNVSGKEAQDWVKADGLKYRAPHGLYGNSEEIAKAYGKLVQLVPQKDRMDVFFPENMWTTEFTAGKSDRSDTNALHGRLPAFEARELAHSITLLRAMVPTMTTEERKAVLNEIRSRHATKTMGMWVNTHDYKEFKKSWPAVDAMLLDLKAALKTEQLPSENAYDKKGHAKKPA